MKKLFLASFFTEVACLLPNFVGEDVAGKKVAFIPTAAVYPCDDAETKETLEFITKSDRAALQSLGLIVENLEVSSVSAKTVEESILNADYIFVGGGDTFFLMQELRRKSADKLISEHIRKGKLYMGTSAGSLLMQKDIVADGVENPELSPDLNGDFTALGFIDFYLYVHYGSNFWGDDDEYIRKFYAELDYVKISDKQAVTVAGDKVEVITTP